ncbi:hypothetical protein [Arcobacter aquimarinus]|uniref:Uncharacterized protein n=1 Tax=Arcobacter aquimarinus TaxID=1315211 RepID=A0AAE7B6C1_9BACT|nr:hypothetical protein [Arcobacter aquimarinus]MCB9096507.1 hypothetical protein [Arcobacter sp.]QKE26480.1 hypothetical protein AAQM_1742 [Arcobacter aquimarinus]RXI33385.1 hypothetical protein CP986_10380 [Arcobacter aquimarinus]
MALPFILGVAVGAGAVIAYKNKELLKQKSSKLFDKSKDFANQTIKKTKDNLEEKCEAEKKENE